MIPPPYAQRARLAGEIERLQHGVAQTVTAEFFRRHPEWHERYGPSGWQHGIDDACFHMRFLAGSIAAGDASRFQDYLRWTARVLSSRGMHTQYLLENIEQIRDALSDVLPERDARIVQETAALGLEALASMVEGTAPVQSTHGMYGIARAMFAQAILQGDRNAAATVVKEALREGADPKDIYVDVIQEALYQVGGLWESNEITVAQEHLATAIAQYVISLIYAQCPPPAYTRGNAIVTGTKGEQHQIGPMMLADVLELEGWNARFLGTDMPARDIAAAVKSHEARLLGISVTVLFSLPRVREVIELCRAQDSTNTLRIIVGGQAFRASPELYKEVGADGFASDLRSACDMIRAWS